MPVIELFGTGCRVGRPDCSWRRPVRRDRVGQPQLYCPGAAPRVWPDAQVSDQARDDDEERDACFDGAEAYAAVGLRLGKQVAERGA